MTQDDAAETDQSAFVRAAVKGTAGKRVSFDAEHMLSMSQLERLGAIALSSEVDGESFAEFIVDGLRSNAISDGEAAELVTEFVRHPETLRRVQNPELPEDGFLLAMDISNFKAIWNLATCTPPKVHSAIVWYYPVQTGTFA